MFTVTEAINMVKNSDALKIKEVTAGRLQWAVQRIWEHICGGQSLNIKNLSCLQSLLLYNQLGPRAGLRVSGESGRTEWSWGVVLERGLVGPCDKAPLSTPGPVTSGLSNVGAATVSCRAPAGWYWHRACTVLWISNFAHSKESLDSWPGRTELTDMRGRGA